MTDQNKHLSNDENTKAIFSVQWGKKHHRTLSLLDLIDNNIENRNQWKMSFVCHELLTMNDQINNTPFSVYNQIRKIEMYSKTKKKKNTDDSLMTSVLDNHVQCDSGYSAILRRV